VCSAVEYFFTAVIAHCICDGFDNAPDNMYKPCITGDETSNILHFDDRRDFSWQLMPFGFTSDIFTKQGILVYD